MVRKKRYRDRKSDINYFDFQPSKLKLLLENEMLTKVLATVGDKIFSFDGHYSNRANAAQACLCTMMSELDGKSVCVGSCVVKRKQNISEAAAKAAPGILCDLPAKKMEAYGLELLTKMIASRTKEQFYLCSAKGFKISTSVTNIDITTFSPQKSVTNIDIATFCP